MTLTLNFQGQILNWLYLSQKLFDCHETKSKHIDLTVGFKCDHWVWPWPWPWPWISKVKYRIGYISAKNGPIATKQKITHRMNSRLQMSPLGLTLAMTLTLNFQGQISNWLYLSHKWCDCHEKKSIHTNWSQDFKCDHRAWPWPWPWPWIFKVKYGIGYISVKNGPIATKGKANTSRPQGHMWSWPFGDQGQV